MPPDIPAAKLMKSDSANNKSTSDGNAGIKGRSWGHSKAEAEAAAGAGATEVVVVVETVRATAGQEWCVAWVRALGYAILLFRDR